MKGASALKHSDVKRIYASPGTILPKAVKFLSNFSAAATKSEAQITCYIDTTLDLPSEGYTLDISREQIAIVGKDPPGLFYAFQTLAQLLEDAQELEQNLPLCNIRDFPSLSYRAIHLDLKHHREKTTYYYALMDRLARYKVNAVIVEMEDKIKYERQPLVGSADALSIDEWKRLSEYAKDRHIEISPLIQGLGHASFILKHEKYAPLRDDPTSDWAFNPLDAKTYEVQFDLYRDGIEATPYGRYLHIGGDEVRTTGRNSGKSALELQLIWLRKVCEFAQEQGRIPIFWDDMPLKHAGVYQSMFNTKLSSNDVDSIWVKNEHKLAVFLDDFPKNCVYMRWNYSSPQAIGNSRAMEWFRTNGLQVMGATAGQTRWVLMPQNESNIDNIKAFAASSIDKGLNGLLLTLWDDDSPHFELYMRGIIAFSEYAWTGVKTDKNALKAAYRHREFSARLADSTYAFIDELEAPVAFFKNAFLHGNKRNLLKSNDNPIDELVIDLPDKSKKGQWIAQNQQRLDRAATVLQQCQQIAIKIATTKSTLIRNSYTIEVYEQVNSLVQFPAKSLLILQSLDSAKNDKEELEALRKLTALSADFAAIRKQFEEVYSKTRLLTKPENYILDQDHHVHLANQTRSFDWQFNAELLFLAKLARELLAK